MTEGFPCYDFLAKPLRRQGAQSVDGHAERECTQELTPIIFCKSLVEYVLMTFTATSRPQ